MQLIFSILLTIYTNFMTVTLVESSTSEWLTEEGDGCLATAAASRAANSVSLFLTKKKN